MRHVPKEQDQPGGPEDADARDADPEDAGRRLDRPWSRGRRLSVSLPIAVILLAALVFVSHATAISWSNEPSGQTIETLTADTAVTFRNTTGTAQPKLGDYAVTRRYITIRAVRPSTGEVQRIRVLIREPKGATGRRPAVVFMHGAGYGTADNSFGDVAKDLSSAGFVTAVLDKPVWSTNDVTRDYPASAKIYDQVIRYLRTLDDVNADKVGIYATSESAWISSYLLRDDDRIAFQILLSPMVSTPRQSLGFLAAQDFSLVGANDGYQSIIRRLLRADGTVVGLTNFDVRTLDERAYSIPTFVAYGSKDVMTAQVSGVHNILKLAHDAGNWDVTIRSYPVANHVLRLGDESESNTQLADGYVTDMTNWAVGTVAGLTQTSERVAGATIYQSIPVPSELRSDRPLTIYGLILHGVTALLVLATLVLSLVALGRRIRHSLLRLPGPSLGFRHGFGGVLLGLTVATLSALMLLGAGFAQVVMKVVRLAWGAAPDPSAGIAYWSWPVIQVVCVLVVWAWSRVLARLVEVASRRGIIRWPPRHGAIREVVSGDEPVLATTRLGRVLFWLSAVTMLHVLLVFAFWGLFLY